MEDGEGSTATVFKTNDLYNFIYEKYADFKFKVDEYVTLSYDWELTGTPSSNTTYPTMIRAEISDTPYGYGKVINSVGTNGSTSTIKNITASQKSGHICIVYKIDSNSSVSNAKKVRFRIDNLLSNYYVTISNLKLEKGNKPTDWTPAPEDIESSVDDIQIGGRNLLQEKGIVSFSNPTNFDKSEFKKSGKVTFTASSTNHGFRFDLKKYYEPNSSYILSFYLTLNVVSGELSGFNNSWHHDKGVNWENYCYIDNVKYNSIAITDTNVLNLISDGNKHKFVYILKSSGTIKDDTGIQYSYIQPGRGSTEPFQFDCIIDNLKLEKGNKPTDWTPAPEDVDDMIAKTVKQVDVEYYLSTSSTSATGGSWSTTAPAWVDGKYMWSRQKVTYVDNTTATRNETCIAGAKGETGSPGGTGATGATGTGVESITEEYYLSTSKSSQTGGSWVTTPPTWSTGKYIWTRSKIVYKNPASTVYTTPLCSSEWEAVNNVNVGGTNLILKSSFLYDTEPTDKNWNIWTVNNISSKHFTVNGYEYKAASDNGAINSSVGLRVSLAQLGLNKGDTISISYDIKGKMGTINNGLAVMHATAASSNFYAKIYAKVNGAAHPTSIPDWTRIKGVWTIDSDFPSNNDYIYIFFGGGTGSEVDLFVRNVKVEKGNKPTEWSPAPEDVDSSIGDVQTVALGAQNTADLAKTVANQATVDINSIKGYIQNLVVDQNGQSMMTQTGSGWQFNMGTINGNLDSLSRAVDDMSDDNQATRALLNNVKSLAESVADKTAYINVDYTTDGSGNPIPRMILGAETSAFKIRITNESIDFMESDTVMAYATSNTFYNLTTVVQKELEIGSGPSFVWTVRSNGNLGLTYKS